MFQRSSVKSDRDDGYLQVDVLGGQRQAAHEDHGDDSRLKVLVLDEAKSLDPEVGPALPEGGILVASDAGEVDVAPHRTAVRRVLRHHHLLDQGDRDEEEASRST